MKVGLVGATGLVGRVMLQVLEERNFPVSEFFPVASAKSVGSIVKFKGRDYPVVSVEDALAAKPDVVLFSAGASVSKEWGPKFASAGSFVIDNSSAWRMEPNIPLVVPEINGPSLSKDDKLIANPNCSTIQMVMVLAPLHRAFQIKRVVVSTYQSVTGTGAKAVSQYMAEKDGLPVEQRAYPHQIFQNVLPHCDVFLDNGYTKEEMKLVNETKKILNDPSIKVTATAVRVPVMGGHSEAVNVEFNQPVNVNEISQILGSTPGVILADDPAQNKYPMPLVAHQKDEVFVGRVRMDDSQPNTVNMWVVADNLRKGAATNAVQIAQFLLDNHLISNGK